MVLRRDRFDLPEGVIYLDGHSLGPLPRAVPARLTEVVREQWATEVVRAWNTAGWVSLPTAVGDRIAPLIGAPSGTVVVGDTLSIQVYQALAAAVRLRPGRRVILSDTGNFPSDLYIAQGLIDILRAEHTLRLVAPDEVEATIDETVAVVLLTEVDYRTGRRHDMARLTERAHAQGALTVWDLAHSAGALPVDVTQAGCDFAVGCTYKYLNGGPGAPAFIYVRPDLIGSVQPAIAGWFGHRAPFRFDVGYDPAPSIERMRIGTPAVLQMAALDAALDVFDAVSMHELRAESIALSERFIAEVETRCPQVSLASPRAPEARGATVSFAFDAGYPVMKALIARGIVGDFRAPNLMRFGFCPLYVTEADAVTAAEQLQSVITLEAWRQPEFQTTDRVT